APAPTGRPSRQLPIGSQHEHCLRPDSIAAVLDAYTLPHHFFNGCVISSGRTHWSNCSEVTKPSFSFPLRYWATLVVMNGLRFIVRRLWHAPNPSSALTMACCTAG